MRWRAIPGCEEHEISEEGRLRRLVDGYRSRAGILLRGSQQGGYTVYRFSERGRKWRVFAHRLVLLAFVGPPPLGHEARHVNGDRSDNRVANLCWGTHAENMADTLTHGTHNRGERHGNAKLSDPQAREIRALVSGGMSRRRVAQMFGVQRTTVSRIVSGRRWGHLETPARSLDEAIYHVTDAGLLLPATAARAGGKEG